MRGSGFVFVLCLIATLFYLFKADESFRAKALVLAVYVGSFFAHMAFDTTLPVGLLIQAGLCIYYVIYFKYM